MNVYQFGKSSKFNLGEGEVGLLLETYTELNIVNDNDNK